jgi:preprotein translocase subunit Sec61beta
MANTGINLPSGFGGLMRYNEEYHTKFSLKPAHVVGLLIFIILLRIGLGLIF